MTRDEIYKDIEDTLGIVPTFIKSIPDEFLQREWELYKDLELGETKIPNKYKELMGVALSAATRCQFCVLYHTEVAKLHGATDEEIQEASHFAKLSTGWSVYLHGTQMDFDEFRRELHEIVEYQTAKKQRQAA